MVNLVPEEVIFATFSLITCCISLNEFYQNVELHVGSVQIDNQLYGSEVPVFLFASPRKSGVTDFSEDLYFCVNIEKDKEFDLLVCKVTAALHFDKFALCGVISIILLFKD